MTTKTELDPAKIDRLRYAVEAVLPASHAGPASVTRAAADLLGIPLGSMGSATTVTDDIEAGFYDDHLEAIHDAVRERRRARIAEVTGR